MLRRILIVDDSLPMHKLIKHHLDAAGLEFHSAYGGEAGIAMASETRPDVILLDVDMPDLNGFEVCRRLKETVLTRSIPIIFLTADCAGEDKVKGMGLGATGYVTKPYKPNELSDRVRASLLTKSLQEKAAMIDGLTGLWNRKYLEDYFSARASPGVFQERSVSCIALDVDGLHQINKKHGIGFGDQIIRGIGSLLMGLARAEDAVCRCEGGHFAIAVSAMSRANAARLASRLCSLIEGNSFSHAGQDVRVTCSFGVVDSSIVPDKRMLDRAAAVMKRAKKNGGNRVAIARERGTKVHCGLNAELVQTHLSAPRITKIWRTPNKRNVGPLQNRSGA